MVNSCLKLMNSRIDKCSLLMSFLLTHPIRHSLTHLLTHSFIVAHVLIDARAYSFAQLPNDAINLYLLTLLSTL